MQAGVAKSAVGRDDGHVGDAGDAIVGVENFFVTETDRPRDFLGLDVVAHERHFLLWISLGVDALGLKTGNGTLDTGDTEDHHSEVFVMGGELADLRKRRDARAAPRGPKIEDDDFPLEVGQRLEAGEGGPFEVELGAGFPTREALASLALARRSSAVSALSAAAAGLVPGKSTFSRFSNALIFSASLSTCP